MTVVVFDRESGTVSMRGHAGAGERGGDIVCAALSILMYTLAAIPGAKLRSGPAWALLRLRRETAAETEAICRGFGLLAEAYPRNVRYKEVNK